MRAPSAERREDTCVLGPLRGPGRPPGIRRLGSAWDEPSVSSTVRSVGESDLCCSDGGVTQTKGLCQDNVSIET